MQRRAFFQLIAGAMIAPVVAQSEGLTGEIFTGPVLWGDGEHDDTEALQALIDGHVVEFADPTMAEGAGWSDLQTFHMPRGTFLTKAAIVFRREGGFDGCVFDGHGCVIHMDFFHGAAMWVVDHHGCIFCNWTIYNSRAACIA